VRAKYFCGNCQREVNARAASCPYCGSSFTAVRCPRCGFEGKAVEFIDGFPSCGFMMQDDVSVPASPAASAVKPRKAASGMSRLFYRVAGLVLIVLLAVLVVLLLLRP
jgi:DNA-directed RNA polymerase subunit RPC12/RpoP